MPILNEDAKTIGGKYLPDKASEFADVKGMGEAEGQLQNIVLSHNPCPDCVAANGQTMTYSEWEASEFGLPGSSGRICEDDCHCILVPVDSLGDFPGLDEAAKLRGDEGSDIRKMIEIGPSEKTLKELMEEWYQLGNQKLPPEIYDMEFDDIEAYMRKLLAGEKKHLGGAIV